MRRCEIQFYDIFGYGDKTYSRYTLLSAEFGVVTSCYQVCRLWS